MTYEQRLANYIVNAKYEDLSDEDIIVVKKQFLAFWGGVISGWNSGGCAEIADMVKAQGGKEEATIMVWNGRVPAQQAAFVNSVMGRALDICDHISPGVHIGSAVIPAAIATAEMMGGCTGEELILAVAVGTDAALRLNLTEDCYDGFDPTGVDAVFAAAAAAAKLMKLDEKQTMHTLALAFNRCCGSFQSNVDGALAVRVIEGWTAQAGVECAKLAARGITGPVNFLNGVYGYFHLFGRDRSSCENAFADLGVKTRLKTLNFKKYPSCGMTQGSTEAIIRLMETHGFAAEDVESVDVTVTPYAAKLVGKKFELGDNPKVDAQFNVGYCVANAILRQPVVLKHFEPELICDPAVLDFLDQRITVHSDAALNEKGHYTSRVKVSLKDGRQPEYVISVIPGTPDNELTPEDFKNRYWDCVSFGGRSDLAGRAEAILDSVNHLEKVKHISELLKPMEGEN